jgi:hypothetical protein
MIYIYTYNMIICYFYHVDHVTCIYKYNEIIRTIQVNDSKGDVNDLFLRESLYIVDFSTITSNSCIFYDIFIYM